MEGNNKKKKNKYYYKNHNNYYKHGNNKFYYKKKSKPREDFVNNIEQNNEVKLNNANEKELSNILLNENNSINESENAIKVSLQDNENFDELEFVPVKKVMNNDNIPSTPKGLFKYVLGVAIIVVVLFGVTYSFFTYTKEDSRQADVASGDVYVKIDGEAVNLSLNRMYPRTKEEARSRNDNYIDFTLKAKNTSETKEIKYILNISNGEDVQGKTRINPQYLMLDLQEKVGSEYNYIKEAEPLSTFDFEGIVPVNTTSEIEKEYRLRIWISDAITISDTESNATYTQAEFANLYANVHVEVNSVDQTHVPTGEEKVRSAILAKQTAQTNSCNPIWVDDMGTTSDTSDDVTYFSGRSTCVNMNYLRYSGKLWRITAIYPDGAFKIVLNTYATYMAYGTSNFTNSPIYNWLNNDFYNTLTEPENVIDTTKLWNATTSSNKNKPPETTMVSCNVGMLNVWEIMTASGDNNTWVTDTYPRHDSSDSKSSVVALNRDSPSRPVAISSNWWSSGWNDDVYEIRPAIYLKPGIEFKGSGTSSDPFEIDGINE